MSGESVSAFSRNKKRDPYQERFEVESDRRLFGCMGSGSVFGFSLAAYALTIQIVSAPIEYTPPPGTEGHWRDPYFTVKPPINYHGKIKERRIAKVHPKPGQAGLQAGKPKTRKPAKEPGSLGVSVIASMSRLNGAGGAYALLPKSVRDVDLDKLEAFGALTRTDATRLGGRLGKQDNGYDGGYNQGGTGGNGEGNIEIPGFKEDPIPGKMRRPGSGTPVVEIDQFRNATSRSTASILAVIRSHSPGLRHLYNTFLKMRPGLAGKITLRFAIAPGGQVVDVGLAGSTTTAPDFDAQVKEKVMSWRFDPVKAIGNDIVTVPFNFSE
ncbi:MAG TPA: AgmX/PglI C-terminal domain-containing protein [Fibrobacteria bacterium]|nr:AgmX/PglI C-terminal domain-containing protein [Fibrobacteria bacterium]